jgi:hypothetical protein
MDETYAQVAAPAALRCRRMDETYAQDAPHGAHGEQSLNRLATSATNHCLTGCLIGEVSGMTIATALGWGTWRRSPWPLGSRSSSATA